MLLITLPRRLLMVSLRGQNIFLSFICFVSMGQIPEIKICHMVASEHPEVIERRWWLIAVDVHDYDEADEYSSIDNYGATLVEEDKSCLLEMDVRTGVTESVT